MGSRDGALGAYLATPEWQRVAAEYRSIGFRLDPGTVELLGWLAEVGFVAMRSGYQVMSPQGFPCRGFSSSMSAGRRGDECGQG